MISFVCARVTATSSNCTDSNNDTGNYVKVYVDNDYDSYGFGSQVDICLVGNNLPLGFSYNNLDCNDNDPDTWHNTTVYLDNDHDSYGAGNATTMCLGPTIPYGYSNNSLDCNDNDSTISLLITGYLDRDIDGYGDNNPVLFCAKFLPFGYVNISGDCNDVNPFVHPSAIDSCNYIDDNCDGKIDDNFSDEGKVCYVGVGECRNSGIMVCNKDGNGTFCKGTPKSPSTEICDSKDNDCDGMIDENNICNDSNYSFILNLPNQATYNKNNVIVNLSLSSLSGKKADKISYIDYSAKKPRETVLCKACNQYGAYSLKTINLQDGEHNLFFKAVVNGTIYNDSIDIFVDSKVPRLYLPKIRTKDYTNGSFFISYDETNLKSITLFYGNENFTEYNCSSGKGKTCNLWVDLSNHSGEDIKFSYMVQDISGNTVSTNNMTAEVDITPPVINDITYPIVGNYVFLKINLTDKNFKDVSFFDNSYSKAKWKFLCSALNDNICEKDMRLSPGEHNITIRALDRAGNSVYQYI